MDLVKVQILVPLRLEAGGTCTKLVEIFWSADSGKLKVSDQSQRVIIKKRISPMLLQPSSRTGCKGAGCSLFL